MKKIILLILVGMIALTGCMFTKPFKASTKEERLEFKKSYEVLNGTKDDEGKEFHTVELSKNNRYVTLTYKETLKFIEEGTGVLVFGRPACPWCRLLITPLDEWAKDNKVKQIYYYDPEKIRDENNDEYKAMLALLDKYLPVDTVTQEKDAKDFDPSLKRIVLPQLFFIKDGKIKASHLAFQNENLVNEDPEKLMEQYTRYLRKIK